MAVADITTILKRINRTLLLTDSYVSTLSNPPKRRSFNSDAELTELVLEADELLMHDVRNTIGHPYAPLFFLDSAALTNGDKIPASDSIIHRVLWSPAAVALGTLTVQPASTGASATGLLTISGSATAATGRLTIPEPTVAATGSLAIVQALYARGSYTFVGTPTDGETISVNGTTFTFRPAPDPTGPLGPVAVNTIPFTNVAAFNAQSMAFALNASNDIHVRLATYSSFGNQVFIVHDQIGTIGNGFTLANSSGGHVTRSGATLTGGVDGIANDEELDVNGIPVVFLYTAGGDKPLPPIETGGGETPVVIYVYVNDDAGTTAINLALALNQSTNPRLTIATYYAVADAAEVDIVFDQFGYIGNSFAIRNSSDDHVVASGTSLTGGLGGITEGETITINGEVFTFSNFNTGTHFIPFDESSAVNVGEIADFLNASVIGAISVATYTYTAIPDPTAIPTTFSPYVTITYDTAGTGGNGYTLTNSSNGAITRSAATLLGGLPGIVEGETVVINGITFTFTNLTSGVTKIPFTVNAQTNSVLMAGILNASVNAAINVATYSLYDSGIATAGDQYGVAITYLTHGGNSYTLANSSGGAVTRSGATLTGGIADGGIIDGETINVNGVLFTFTNNSSGATDISFSADINANAAAIQAKLAASVNVLLTVATYTELGPVVTISGPANFTITDSSEGNVLASGATLDGDIWYDSEEADRADIIEVVRATTAGNDTMFGPAVQTYGYHDIVAGELYSTSPFVKVTQAPWTRTTVCQSPMSYTTAIVLLGISLAPKDGLDPNLLKYADQKASEFRQMIRSGAMILPEVQEFGLNEVSP